MIENLSAYHTFYTVAKLGNISNASKELFISQPAVSKAITKLESNLNTTLFYRTSKGVTLTHEGTILYEKLAEAFHAIELGEERLRYESNLGIGHLSIGVSTTLCKYILLPYLKAFVQKYPHITISIACKPTKQTLKDLESGSIDLGLIAEPTNQDMLHFLKIVEVEDMFVTTKSYVDNLKIRTGIDVQTEDISKVFSTATVMLLNKENLTRQYVDKFLIANEIYPQNLLEASTMDLLIDFAKIDLGIACVIKNFVEKDLKCGNLIPLKLPFNILKRNIGFSWQDKTLLNPSLSIFVDYIQSQFQ